MLHLNDIIAIQHNLTFDEHLFAFLIKSILHIEAGLMS